MSSYKSDTEFRLAQGLLVAAAATIAGWAS